MDTGRSSAASKPGTGPVPKANDSTYNRVNISATGPTIPDRDGIPKAAAITSIDAPWPTRLIVSSCLHALTRSQLEFQEP